ncbi:(2S)-3-sulfopropanediol dehydratase activating enzyme [Desulfovibrio sp. Fe33]|uniref:(2S)-3-sulfopropanediol dehydratase activating enzyme n=1 Tax=Desulfovibrio sp. Fe33 TaxID=3020842 RepID=UPI00234D1F89|nr:glycyl-radical enzyme activating protein [Desulfovibrio sp. Fe33]
MSSLLDKKVAGTVFSIQKYSVHDGPGIRTIVFLKGCPLRCKWCSNPESQLPQPELAYNRNKCLGLEKCVRCTEVCGACAITEGEDGKIDIDRDICTGCLHCTEACPAGALITYGEETTVDKALKRVEEDEMFYARSGGGLTLSGGEPFQQPEFATALLREARNRHLNTAVESCGAARYEDFKEALQYVNTLMFDVKSMNSEKHKAFTSQPNERILRNLRHIREDYPTLKIRVRTPVIPGFNDTEEDIAAVIEFLKTLPGDKVEYEILEYHRMGQPKYENTGREYPLPVDLKLDPAVFARLKKLVDEYND